MQVWAAKTQNSLFHRLPHTRIGDALTASGKCWALPIIKEVLPKIRKHGTVERASKKNYQRRKAMVGLG